MTEHNEIYSKTILGFWIYLLTDFMMFGALFATYAVLMGGTYGGPTARDLFCLPFTLTQTLILLVGGLTAGLGEIVAKKGKKEATLILFGLTFLLGLAFMGMELTEFTALTRRGADWQASAFLSAYFTLVGTHGIHVIFGLLWILVFMIPVYRSGLTDVSLRRITCLRMFWQFLNVVWVFIFSLVYLLGVGGV
ncbi:MAG: cytochrome c oxidase subunit 3 [Simkaniaceae bacterium]|nr:cytochrome c oxidase subunit 3 [Simkaniaceae bacterium]